MRNGFFIAALFLFTIRGFSQPPRLVLPVGHTASVNYAEFSPDGKYVVTASEDGTAKLWRVMDGKLLRDLKGHSYWIDLAIFSPDGRFIATASNDNTVKIWETKTGKLLHTLKGLTPENKLGNGGISIHTSFSPGSNYIVTSSNADMDAGKARVWLTSTGALVKVFSVKDESMIYPDFSEDGKALIINDKSWDIGTGKSLAHSTNQPRRHMLLMGWDTTYTSADGRIVASLSAGANKIDTGTIEIKDKATGKRISILDNIFSEIKSIQFSFDNKYVLTSSEQGPADLWQTATGTWIRSFEDHTNHVEQALFAREGQSVIIYSYEDEMPVVWNMKTGNVTKSNKFVPFSIIAKRPGVDESGETTIYMNDTARIEIIKKGPLAAAYGEVEVISADGRYMVTAEGTWETIAKVWDVATGKLIQVLRGHTGVVRSAHFSGDGKRIITAAFDETSIIWETKTGKALYRLPGHISGTRSAAFSPNGKLAVTAAGDNSVRLWNAGTGKLLATFITLDSTDHFTGIPAGYYTCTPDAAKLLHYVTNNNDVISFEQLDVRYNRPDKVLENIGSRDTALIRAYRNAYYKRIRKLGLDTTAFREGIRVPESDILNRNSIDFEQIDSVISLHMVSEDTLYGLDRFNVWVNEVPLFGSKGISLRNRNINRLDTVLPIKLSAGENSIESSVTNINGHESFRMPVTVNYKPTVKSPVNVYLIGIGIDHFKDNRHDLLYSVKDIRDLAAGLNKKYGKQLIVDTLFNEAVSVGNVVALKRKFLKCQEDDIVMLAYSGHGLLSKDFDYYLSSYNMSFDKPETQGIPYEILESLLDSIPSRKKLMLIDACHSGEVDKDDLVFLNTAPDSLIKGLKPVAGKKDNQLGLANSYELMKSLFVNVGKSTGATVISAAAGTQFALERNDLENGVFTFCILEAMKNNFSMTVSLLKKIVADRVSELTHGRQQPTSRNENIMVDWSVW